MSRLWSLEEINRHNRAGLKRPVIWELGGALGLVGSVVVIVGTTVILSTGRLEIRHNLSRLVPPMVRSYFEREFNVEPQQDIAKAAAELLKKAAPREERKSTQPNSFGVGDSQELVAKVQGQPTRKDGGVWYYGDSSVRFVTGHVVSWTDSSASPLRVR